MSTAWRRRECIINACLSLPKDHIKTKNIPATLVAEVLGTGVIGGLAAYPLAMAFMPDAAAAISFYGYVVPFLVSTVVGSILAGILVAALRRSGALRAMSASLESSH